jgi:hypothetical protein
VVVDSHVLWIFGNQVYLVNFTGYAKIAYDLDDDAGVWGIVALTTVGKQKPERQESDR